MLATGYPYELLRKVGLTDFQARTGEFLLVRPLKVVLIVVIAAVVGKIATRAVRRSVRSLQSRAPLRSISDRAEQRAATIAEVLASVLRALIWFVAVLIIFGQLGIDLAPLLAGAGIAGIAVGLGAQSLVRDVISGLFIIVEDQYGVGDAVTLGDTSGTIEEVNLRVTRLRGVDGSVWFVPNGEIRRVGNNSLQWSRAVVDIPVGRDVDLARAMDTIERAAADIGGDPAWNDVVLERPEVWGVESMGSDGVTVRVAVKTAADRQASVGRALRQRIANALRQVSDERGVETMQARPESETERPSAD